MSTPAVGKKGGIKQFTPAEYKAKTDAIIERLARRHRNERLRRVALEADRDFHKAMFEVTKSKEDYKRWQVAERRLR